MSAGGVATAAGTGKEDARLVHLLHDKAHSAEVKHVVLAACFACLSGVVNAFSPVNHV